MRLFILASVFGLVSLGCGESTPDSQVATTGYPPSYPPTATAPVTATAPTTAPPPVGGPAQPVAASMGGPLATAGLTLAAGADAKGMTAVGEPFAGQFQPGQTLEHTFSAEPGKCYTLSALGGPGISELDAQVSLATGLPNLPAQYQDNQTGPNATIGGGGNCVRNNPLMAVPMKVTLKVTNGNGIAVAQIYKK